MRDKDPWAVNERKSFIAFFLAFEREIEAWMYQIVPSSFQG